MRTASTITETLLCPTRRVIHRFAAPLALPTTPRRCSSPRSLLPARHAVGQQRMAAAGISAEHAPPPPPHATLQAPFLFDHDGGAPSAMAFNTWHADYANHFACTFTNAIMLFTCQADGSIAYHHTCFHAGRAENADAAAPSTAAPEPNADAPGPAAGRGGERYAAVAWMVGAEERVLIAAGGQLGAISIVDFHTRRHIKTLMGQGDAITNLCAHPSQPSILLSASKDGSVWVWHVERGVCCMVLVGIHRGPVLTVDVSGLERMAVVTAGEDARVCVWNLREHWHLVDRAAAWEGRPSDFPTKQVTLPGFVASRVHSSPIQQAWFHGGLFVSQCVAGSVRVWQWNFKRGVDIKEGSSEVLLELEAPPPSDGRPPRFSMTAPRRVLALRSGTDEVAVYRVGDISQRLSLRPNPSVPIRGVALSHDGSMVLCCCANGRIYRWDICPPLDPATHLEIVPDSENEA
ncbi:hypothetical protein CLOM_g9714 [Closterium sp. NIES-68]|nr:hypothetical protein CLOM_g9714 [Closterium sp. NIES-68]GJP60584.1 hypothetical protein CLOP_g17822 [Closterium sp. NIES-67]